LALIFIKEYVQNATADENADESVNKK